MKGSDDSLISVRKRKEREGKEVRGMLMFNIIESETEDDWRPGYFVVTDGYLYCYTDSSESSLYFLAQLFNNFCKGCRRLANNEHEIARPNVIELTIVIENLLKTIHIAASNEKDATKWMEALLMSINIKSCETFGFLKQESALEKFCTAVVTDDFIHILVQDTHEPYFKVLDCLNISDIIAAYYGDSDESSSFCFLMLELDSESTTDTSGTEWILYFLADIERTKFYRALKDSWEKLFQISMCATRIDENAADGMPATLSIVKETLKRLVMWHTNSASMLHE